VGCWPPHNEEKSHRLGQKKKKKSEKRKKKKNISKRIPNQSRRKARAPKGLSTDRGEGAEDKRDPRRDKDTIHLRLKGASRTVRPSEMGMDDLVFRRDLGKRRRWRMGRPRCEQAQIMPVQR